MLKELENTDNLIDYNKVSHDLEAHVYDSEHIEIFNITEQNRIYLLLRSATALLNMEANQIKALDFGAGTGNLTKHLLALDINTVIASDVSTGCLEKISQQYKNDCRLSTLVLNGKNLSNVEDDSFDLVASYSVLHHVPDYIKIVDELVRVSKPGGLIIIDHEACSSYWQLDKSYLEYLDDLGGRYYSDHLFELGVKAESEVFCLTILNRLRKILSLRAWKDFVSNLFKNIKRGMTVGGDIHVFIEDHIEWDTIRSRLRPHCDFLVDEDYLVCRERSEPTPVWHKWCDKVSDMHLVMARKR